MDTEYINNYGENEKRIGVALSIVTAIVILLFYQLAGGILNILFPGIPPMLLQIGTQSLFMFVPTVFALKASKYRLKDTLGPVREDIVYTSIISIAGIVLCNVVVQGQINLQDSLVPDVLLDSYNQVKEFFDSEYIELFGSPSFANIAFALAGACAVPAISEEFLFRGYLLRVLSSKYSTKTSVIATSLIFALVHFNPVNFVALFLIGLLLSFLVIRTGSLYASILAHFLNNLFSIASYYADYPTQASDIMKIAWYVALPMIVCGTILLILLFKWDWNRKAANN